MYVLASPSAIEQLVSVISTIIVEEISGLGIDVVV